MIDYYELRNVLKEHLKLEITEHSKSEMEARIKFDDCLISRTRWKK